MRILILSYFYSPEPIPKPHELAATIALQRSPPKRHRALHHLLAIALLEPEFALHQVRLAALYTQMGQRKDARRAAQKAMTLDPDAPVSKFIE